MKLLKFKNPFRDLTRFELILWLSSLALIIISFVFTEDKSYLTLTASLIGATALIFLAKGYVLGQVLVLIFALFYGIISFRFRYYGELITYVGMSAPIALFSIFSWCKNPFEKKREVRVRENLNRRQIILLLILTAAVTVAFYFILSALNNKNIVFSTISVATSFIAASLSFLRSPYYALGYSLNDIVLVVLWLLASIENTAYLPMIICFLVFLVNDIYGFISWRRMQRRQRG